jgi:hypothetical protein
MSIRPRGSFPYPRGYELFEKHGKKRARHPLARPECGSGFSRDAFAFEPQSKSIATEVAPNRKRWCYFTTSVATIEGWNLQ